MCGIVGVVAERNAVPILMEGCAAWNIAATTPRPGGVDVRSAAGPGEGRGEGAGAAGPAGCEPLDGHVASPHALGHARRPDDEQRPSAHVRRRHRHRSQRHHRKSRGPARRLIELDTASIRRPTPRSSRTAFIITWGARPICSRRCAARWPNYGRLRPGGHFPERPGLPGGGPRGLSRRDRARDRREFRGFGRGGAAAVTRRFMFLEEGTSPWCGANPSTSSIGRERRPESAMKRFAGGRGGARQYRHFMLKEITSSRAPLHRPSRSASPARAAGRRLRARAQQVFKRVKACTSPRAARAFMPAWWPATSSSNLPHPGARRNRQRVPLPESGGDARHPVRHHLAVRRNRRYAAALRNAARGLPRHAHICNVAESSMVRDSDLVLLTRAGRRSAWPRTKAFTTQLTALGMLVVALAKHCAPRAIDERISPRSSAAARPGGADAGAGRHHPALAEIFADKHHALFVGRGPLHAIAMEGALKLKEISYIHAEAYAAPSSSTARWRWSTRTCGGCGGAEQRAAGEIEIEPAGGAGARREALRLRRSRDRHGKRGRRHRDSPAGQGHRLQAR